MKSILSALMAIVLGFSARAELLTEISARYGHVDTGYATKTILSPDLSVLYSLGDSGTHAVGLAYGRFNWSDAKTYIIPVPAGSADMISRVDIGGRAHWDCLTARYDFAVRLSDHLRLRLSPGIGGAWAVESSSLTTFGGIGGIMRTQYERNSRMCLVTEANAVLSLQLPSRWRASAGIACTHIQSPGREYMLTGTLSATQAVTGVQYSF